MKGAGARAHADRRVIGHRCARATRSRPGVPALLRRVGGANIDVFIRRACDLYTADGSVNFAHLLVGSSGTLAWTRRSRSARAVPTIRALGVIFLPPSGNGMYASSR